VHIATGSIKLARDRITVARDDMKVASARA
jgi:hypothetical protein